VSFPNHLPQIFALGLLPGIISNSHVPFTPDPSHPSTINFASYSNFNRTVNVPPGSTEANHYNFHMGTHPPSVAGSISALPEQRPTVNGTQSSTPTAWPRSSNIRGQPARSNGGFYVGKDTNCAPSSRVEGATRTHTFPDTFSGTSSPAVYSTQSPSSTFSPHPHSRFSTGPFVPQGPAYPAPRRGSSPPVSPPVSPSRHSFLSSAASSEKPAPRPVPQKECVEQEKSGHTLRSVRTRFGDVYAEFERAGSRWVCQCGSTFVRDSDWERHAMHSLSHSEGGGYDCSICDISFTRSDAMFRHRRKKHGDTAPGAKGAGG
jgi:hypothetical protein